MRWCPECGVALLEIGPVHPAPGRGLKNRIARRRFSPSVDAKMDGRRLSCGEQIADCMRHEPHVVYWLAGLQE